MGEIAPGIFRPRPCTLKEDSAVHEPEKTASNNPPSNQRPTQVRWLIFGLACAVSWLLYLHRYAWGAIKPGSNRSILG